MARGSLDHFNWPILLVTLAIMTIGLVSLYSATYDEARAGLPPLFVSQAIFMGLGLVVMAVVCAVDYRIYERLAYFIYGANCLLLVLILAIARVVAGSQRWFHLGPISLQPSETAKLALVLALAKFFHHDSRPGGYSLPELWRPAILVAIPAFLIFEQPDLGSCLFQLFIFSSMCLFARVRWRSIAILVMLSLVIGPLAYNYALDDYQRDRIHTFLQPERDPRGKGYQTIQARYAIGAGRLHGTGFLAGTQTHQGFIPEQQTDFIFTVLAEEWGLAGSMTLLLLYFMLILLGLFVAAQAKERFGVFLAVGVVTIFFLQVSINLGGVLGLLPLTGITLPLMSYGGSSVISLLIGVGLLLNISMRRYMF